MNKIIKAAKQGSHILSEIQNTAVNTAQSKRIWQRMEIDALCQCNISYRHISWFCSCHLQTVKRWIVRIEFGEPISDHPRNDRPPIFTQDICIRTIAFYCQISSLAGCSTWSLRWAEKYLRKHLEVVGCVMSHLNYWAHFKSPCLTPSPEEVFLASN